MVILSQWGSMLTERDLGKEIRSILEHQISQNGQVVIDLSQIDMINSSFADEVFGKLIERIGFQKSKEIVTIVNCKRSLKAVINSAISTRLSIKV